MSSTLFHSCLDISVITDNNDDNDDDDNDDDDGDDDDFWLINLLLIELNF